ncbi:unnamed protein product [Symbiodinium necroappetens]|uniref:Uncharacterized protein n=1 Tax=Symbiodinium necroappetens TaxID=1628268 RepID=A0A813BXZ9_9DINO|nr:unnamed protein product [Symbiodinium necroappetens]
MALLLSAASETQDVPGQTYTTPGEITAKYMWTPPIPQANELVDQLAEADVFLSQDAIAFFMSFCAGHRGLFIRSMEWVQEKQSTDNTCWDLARALGEVSQAWDTDSWTETPDESLMGKLQTVRAIRVNGGYSEAESIPQQFVNILCEGPTDGMDPKRRRELTIHGFVLPVLQGTVPENVEFTRLDWAKVGTKYGVANYLMASYYRQVLAKKRGLKVDVDRSPGKVDIYATMQDGSTFAIEAVMASRGRTKIDEHRGRFDNIAKSNYADAQHKCLLIIGRQDSKMRDVVGAVKDGIEVVGLAANPAHSGYHVYVKRQGNHVVDFFIPCDGVARRFSWKDEEPFFEISSAQKLNYIMPGSSSAPSIVWMRELIRKDCAV